MTTLTLLADENILGLQDLIRSLPGLDIKLRTCAGRQISAQALADVDVLFVRSVTQVNEALLKNSPVQFVGTATAGLEHIDIGYLKKRGIHFCSAQGANANAVAEYVMAAMAFLSREQGQNYFTETIGIVGHGHVGKALERKLKALDCDIRLYDPWLQQANQNKAIYSEWSELVECGVISFHVPLVKESPFPTFRMMDKAFFNGLADDCLLVNAARGEICDEAALLEAIKSSHIKTVWDVWDQEPDINRQLLAEVDLATPHIAGYSLDAKLNASQYLIKVLSELLGKTYGMAEFPASMKKSVNLDVGDKQLFDIILHPYNPCEDSRALKTHSEVSLAKHFDELRKNYQHRLEWHHYQLAAQQLPDELAGSLEGLGFHLVPDEKF